MGCIEGNVFGPRPQLPVDRIRLRADKLCLASIASWTSHRQQTKTEVATNQFGGLTVSVHPMHNITKQRTYFNA
jgi:hypothetical protein